MLKISNINAPIGYDITTLKKIVTKKIGISNFSKFVIIKQSIDARKKNDIHYTLTLGVEFDGERKFANGNDIVQFNFLPQYLDNILPLASDVNKKVVVVGSGPAGLFCALSLAKRGLSVVVVERGSAVEERQKKVNNFWNNGILDENCNVQFGEGGAGTFSDGKLNTGIKSEFIGVMLNEFIKYGAPEQIGFEAKAHIGTDRLVDVVKNMRNAIINLGGSVLFNSKMVGFETQNNKVKTVQIEGDNGAFSLPADALVLAIGHSARDTFEMLQNHNICIEQKEFSVGLRIEHNQQLIDVAQYGKVAPNLPAADYKMATRTSSGRGCYTFCMCPGGVVVCASSQERTVVTNGMSNFARNSGFSNSAILVNVGGKDFGSDDALAGVKFQQKYESMAYNLCGNYNAPAQNVTDFLQNKVGKIDVTTIKPRAQSANLYDCLPKSVAEGIAFGLKDFGKKIVGFSEQGVLIGVESRSSSPVKIVRDDNFECNIKGIYPCGEGCGYAGGITSASVDGIKVAIEIIKSER
ncbi:MAG: FAD-dependent oxidoreductase [Clostridia bacterium]